MPILLLWLIPSVNASEINGENRTMVSADDWAAIEQCLGIIRKCQLEDGMIRMKAAGSPVWTVPYCSNFAVMALLAAHAIHPNQPDLRRVERWLIWYADKQEPDGTICDREGNLESYRSQGKRDSTDSYAATFLMAVYRYQRAVPGVVRPEIIQAARKVLTAIGAVVQSDGLTIAKPDYPVKYLMDNLEVYGGLQEGALFFDATENIQEARKARQLAKAVKGSLQKFWSEKEQCFGCAIDLKDNLSCDDLSKPYPHGLAQLFALAHLAPERTILWQRLRKCFSPEDKGMPTERWLMAAMRCAESDEREDLRRAMRQVMLRFTLENVYVDRPALAILALSDESARFPDITP